MAQVLRGTFELKQNYRQSFEVKKAGKSILFQTLVLNPEDLTFDEPVRASVTQTLGGAYVTDFGQGLPSVVIAGTTGYKKRTTAEGQLTDGFQAFRDFRDRIHRDFITTNDPQMELFWYNWEDEEYYQVQPMNFRLQRNKAEPLLYRYEFRFTCLRKLKDAKNASAKPIQPPQPQNSWSVISTAISRSKEITANLKH